MSAKSAADYTLQQKNIADFTTAAVIEGLGLFRAGLLQVSDGATYGNANTWNIRGDVRDTTAWQAPTADTDLTVNDLTSHSSIGVVIRRAQVYGIEDLAKLAANDPTATQRAVELLRRNANYNINYFLHNSLLPAMFDSSNGCLYSTHYVDGTSGAFTDDLIASADAIYGENAGDIKTLVMHSKIYHNLRKQGLIDEGDPDLKRELNETGLRYGGMILGKDIILDDMCYNSSNVYNTYGIAQNAILMGYEEMINVTLWRDELKAGGMDLMKYNLSFSPHVWGTTFAGTAPTVIAGATDAAVATATNWTQRTDKDGNNPHVSEIGVVCIQSLEA